MTYTEKISLGHQVDDFILSCDFAGYSCDVYVSWLFLTFYNYIYDKYISIINVVDDNADDWPFDLDDISTWTIDILIVI